MSPYRQPGARPEYPPEPEKKPPSRKKKDPLDELEETVARMRALGVTEWAGIKLGPAPAPKVTPPTREEIEERRARREERQRDIRFAASRIKPALPKKKKDS